MEINKDKLMFVTKRILSEPPKPKDTPKGKQ